MDRLENYRRIIESIIREYASYKPSHGQIDTEIIIDPARNHFELMHIGWDRHRRVHGSVVHIDIIGDKVWVQHDGTSRPVAEEMARAGIPKSDIVIGFHPADERKYTEYALG